MSTPPSTPLAPSPINRLTNAGERTREAILRVAISLAATEGLSGLSIGRLSEALGMSKSGLFRHFGSKEELEISTIDAASAIFIEDVVRPALQIQRGAPRLWALFRSWISYAQQPSGAGGCFFSSVAMEFDSRPGRVRDRIAHVMKEWVGVLLTATEQAVELGHLLPDTDRHQLVFEIHALAEGANAWYLLHDDSAIFRRAEAAARARISVVATPSCPALDAPDASATPPQERRARGARSGRAAR